MNKQELICELNSQKDKPTVNYFTLEKREGYQEGMRIAKFIAEKLDEPQKVKVPDEFDMWYKEIKTRWSNESSAKHFALWKICQYGFGWGFEDVNGNRISNTLSLTGFQIIKRMLSTLYGTATRSRKSQSGK